MRGISFALAAALALAGCAEQQRSSDPYGAKAVYNGPQMAERLADLIVIDKSDRKMSLYSKGRLMARYDVQLGFAPEGHKTFEGDGRTPEGLYTIDRRNPQSKFHLSLGVSYPHARDMAKARSAGVSPGGDIFIHGQPNGRGGYLDYDWTEGCIAVSDEAMRAIWSMVPTGTPIRIKA